MSEKSYHKDLSDADAKTLGNFTKNAVKQFENNIVDQTDYLEKVEKAQEKDEKRQPDSFS